MTGTDRDVVVVGAGPTGLTPACSLRLHGLSVRVVDRAQGPATTSRANFLHARGLPVNSAVGGQHCCPTMCPMRSSLCGAPPRRVGRISAPRRYGHHVDPAGRSPGVAGET